jgi:hypothetical protein
MYPNTSAPTLPQQLSPASDDDQLVDRIIYLASLASAQEAIDSIIEPLREVTARRQPDTPLSGEDRQQLQDVEARLKKYLVSQDPLRSFDDQSLEDYIVVVSCGGHGLYSALWLVYSNTLFGERTPVFCGAAHMHCLVLPKRPQQLQPEYTPSLCTGKRWYYCAQLGLFALCAYTAL